MKEDDKRTFKLLGKLVALQLCLLVASYIIMSFVPNTSEFINAKESYFKIFYPMGYIAVALCIIVIITFFVILFRDKTKNPERRGSDES